MRLNLHNSNHKRLSQAKPRVKTVKHTVIKEINEECYLHHGACNIFNLLCSESTEPICKFRPFTMNLNVFLFNPVYDLVLIID